MNRLYRVGDEVRLKLNEHARNAHGNMLGSECTLREYLMREVSSCDIPFIEKESYIITKIIYLSHCTFYQLDNNTRIEFLCYDFEPCNSANRKFKLKGEI